MHKPELVPQNELHKILWDFEIQTNYQISIKRPDLVLIKKKKRTYLMDFAILVDHRVEIKVSEKMNKYLDLARELKKTEEHEGDSDTNCSWCTWNDL